MFCAVTDCGYLLFPLYLHPRFPFHRLAHALLGTRDTPLCSVSPALGSPLVRFAFPSLPVDAVTVGALLTAPSQLVLTACSDDSVRARRRGVSL